MDVPSYYVDESGIRLGNWIFNMRAVRRRNDLNGARISDEKIEELNEIGMIWEKKQNVIWEKSYAEARKYSQKHGNLNIPVAYETENGCHLGKWIRDQREAYRKSLTVYRKQKLDAIGIVWEKDDPWENKYLLAKKYFNEHGDLKMPGNYVVEGVWLCKWLNEQKLTYEEKRKNKALTAEQIQKLKSIGVNWEVSNNDISWQQQYEQAKKFYQANGHLTIPKSYVSSDGKRLGVWVQRQRGNYKLGILKDSQIALLNEISMVWEFDDPWMTGYEHAKEYFDEFGKLDISYSYACQDGYNLGKWISNQRAAYNGTARKGLSEEQISLLNAIGMIWNVSEFRWECSYKEAERYYQIHGDFSVPRNYISKNGINLFTWLEAQKSAYLKNELSQEKIAELNSIDIDWLFFLERA